MAMSHFEELGLLPFCRQLNFVHRNLFFGTNPGIWKSRVHANRLIFILDSDGESSFRDSQDALSLKTGMWVLVPAFHEITHEQNPSMVHLSIHFNLEIYRGCDIFSRFQTLFSGTDPVLSERVRQFVRVQNRLFAAMDLMEFCWTVLNRILKSAGEPFDELISGYSRYERLFVYLQEHCHAGVDVGEMASVMRMNKETFIKKFIYDTGFSPKKFFNRILVEKAARLLGTSGMAVREVASELEFCNEFYFSRFFRQHLGVPPSEYRKRYGLQPENLIPVK